MSARILIVDDDPHNVATVESILQPEGYALLVADDGPSALARAQAERPDLVLLDVMLPGMDGFVVTRRIRADPEIGRIPIILITALDDERSRLEGLAAGADDFVSKPCNREELRTRVRTVTSLNRFRMISEQRARFERLFALAPGGILLVDPADRVVAANSRAAPHRAGEWVAAPLRPDAADTLRGFLRAVRAGASPEPCELRVGDGTAERIWQVRATLVPEEAGELVMLVLDDVTVEVRAREALERLNTDLEAKVRARTRQLEEANALLLSYASFVSHDLRSPLAVVKGYLSLLQDGIVPTEAPAAPLVAQAAEAAGMMDQLIHNILQLAQEEHAGEAGGRHATEPEPVVRRVFQHLKQLHPQNAATLVVGRLPRVGVSAVLLERVFYNLLGNALKYSAHRPQPRIEIGAQGGEEGVVLFVRDNGVGFDARDADNLFQEFSRLPSGSAADGFGLGLSLVARLLRVHGGRMWAEGHPGAGATFHVQLPPSVEAIEPAAS